MNDLKILLFITLLGWHLIGLLTIMSIKLMSEGPIADSKNLEFVNPTWLHKQYNLKTSQLIFTTVVYSILCPMATLLYWIGELGNIIMQLEEEQDN